MHTVISRYHFVLHSRQQLIAISCPRVVYCSVTSAFMSGGTSSDWWDGWEWRGEWKNTPSSDPQPLEQAPDESALNTIHRLQDQLQQTLAITQRRSHKTESERVTSCSKGNAAFTAMEEVIEAREWQIEAKRAYDQKFAEAELAEEVYHNAIRRTLEKTEALERHVKTVTMRTDSLAYNESSFFQTLIERQEESIRGLNTLYGQLCQPHSTPDQYRPSGRDRGVAFMSHDWPLTSPSQPFLKVSVCLATERASMDEFVGLMVPRPTQAADLSREEKAIVWNLIIWSGHIPSSHEIL